jgi:branched-chain amino acid transport system substrate-binding protein
MKTMLILVIVLFSAMLLAGEIQVGLIFDMSGPTRDVCQPFVRGIFDYFEFTNNNGGVNGNQIIPVLRDDKYSPDVAEEAYEDLKEMGIKIIHGWGTGSCLRLLSKVNSDEIVFFSASYDDSLGDAENAPFNFFVGASYSMQSRVALRFIKNDYKGSGSPTVAVLRNSTSFGASPFDASFYKEAKDLGIKIIEEIVELNAQEANEQIKSIINQGANYGIIQQTLGASIAISRSAAELGFEGKLIGLNWAFDEALIPVLLEQVEGVMGFPLFAQWAEDVEGMRVMKKFIEEKMGRLVKKPSKYMAGWATADVLVKGLENVDDYNSGPAIKKGIEKVKNYSVGEMCAPVSFSEKEHRGQTGAKMYIIKDGTVVPYTDEFLTLD